MSSVCLKFIHAHIHTKDQSGVSDKYIYIFSSFHNILCGIIQITLWLYRDSTCHILHLHLSTSGSQRSSPLPYRLQLETESNPPLQLPLVWWGTIWDHPVLLPVCMSSPHWQQLPIILPAHRPISAMLPWLRAHIRAPVSHLWWCPPTHGMWREKTRNDVVMKGKTQLIHQIYCS